MDLEGRVVGLRCQQGRRDKGDGQQTRMDWMRESARTFTPASKAL